MHAIALANDTVYGLSASLFTRDLRSALRYVDRIDVGMVRVNGDTTGVDPHAPFGGMKGSSSGSREQGPAAREFYTEIKTVQINAMIEPAATHSSCASWTRTRKASRRAWSSTGGRSRPARRWRSGATTCGATLDHLRRGVVCEPRGHAAIVGALLTPPVTPGAHAGIVFFNNETYLGMCGHGLIGVVRTLSISGGCRPASRVSTRRWGPSRPS